MSLILYQNYGDADHSNAWLGPIIVRIYLLLMLQVFGATLSFATESVDAKPQSTAPPGMVFIPGGEFLMGSDKALSRPDEQPAHQVKVDIRWFRCLGLTQWLMQNGLANACRQKLNGNLHREEG